LSKKRRGTRKPFTPRYLRLEAKHVREGKNPPLSLGGPVRPHETKRRHDPSGIVATPSEKKVQYESPMLSITDSTAVASPPAVSESVYARVNREATTKPVGPSLGQRGDVRIPTRNGRRVAGVKLIMCRQMLARHNIAVFLLGMICLAGCSAPASSASTQAIASVSSSAWVTAPLSPSGEMLLQSSGASDAATKSFTVKGSWYLELRYDCSGDADSVIVQVAGGDSRLVGGITEKNVQGMDIRYYAMTGTFHIEISTKCKWQVTVTA